MPSIRLLISAAALVAGTGSAMADTIASGTYGCFTRGGNEIEGRRFVIGDNGNYGVGTPDGGTYRQSGHRVFFRGGPLDGHELGQTQNGRLRISDKIYCRKVLDPVVPDGPPPEPSKPAKSAPPPAKLIKVKTAAPDPRIIKVP